MWSPAPWRKPSQACERPGRAEAGLPGVGPEGDGLAGAALVGLGAADQQAEAALRHHLDIAERQPDQLRAAQRPGKAQQQQGPVAGAERRLRPRPGRQHLPQHVGPGGGGLLGRAGALGAGDALEQHDQAGVAEVEGDAGEAVGGLDGGERHPQAGEAEAAVGGVDGVHGDGLGVAGERRPAEAGAPGLVGAPGGAVGAAGAVAAGPGRIDRGAGGERLQRRGLLGACRAPGGRRAGWSRG